MIKAKDESVIKLLLKTLNEQEVQLKQAHNAGVWSDAEYKTRLNYIKKKKASARKGNFIF
jgi:hypothetical protein